MTLFLPPAKIADQHFWLGGWSGLFRVAAAELESAFTSPSHQVKGELFDFNDGLLGPVHGSIGQFGQAGCTESPMGGFGLRPGLGWRSSILCTWRNRLPPPVHIQGISAGGKTFTNAGPLEFPLGTRDCQIEYAGLCYANPAKVRYKYRLSGLDTEWTDAGNRRQASYSNLRPGQYSFQVCACNNEGVWNEAADTLTFSILPAFYETAWFPPLCAAVAALTLWGLYRFRLARVTARMNLQLEGQIAERKRIAQELHDTLLQGFTGIGLKLEAITSKLPESLGPTKAQLQRILQQSDHYLSEARRSVWKLRSTSLEATDDFAAALSDAIAPIVENTGLHLAFSVEGRPFKLSARAEDNLLRVCVEAVVNAVKHAQASRIEVTLAFHAAEVRLRIRDDGRGFDPAAAGSNPGHFGLAGIRERMEALGGSVTVQRHPEGGTEVVATVLPRT